MPKNELVKEVEEMLILVQDDGSTHEYWHDGHIGLCSDCKKLRIKMAKKLIKKIRKSLEVKDGK